MCLFVCLFVCLFFSQTTTRIISTASERKNKQTNKQNNNTCFRYYLYSAGTQYGNLHHLSATMNRATYLFCRPTHETVVGQSQHRKTSGEFFEKNAGEWTRRVEISEEEITGSRRSMRGYVRTCFRLKRENLRALSTKQMSFQFLRPRYHSAGSRMVQTHPETRPAPERHPQP